MFAENSMVHLNYSEAMPMPSPIPNFQVEIIDGYRLGRLQISLNDVADWLNFLVTPHYRTEIVSAEQTGDRLNIYFEANEGVYTYLAGRLMGYWDMAA